MSLVKHSTRVVFADGESYCNGRYNIIGMGTFTIEPFQSWDLIDAARVLDIQLNTSLRGEILFQLLLQLPTTPGKNCRFNVG